MILLHEFLIKARRRHVLPHIASRWRITMFQLRSTWSCPLYSNYRYPAEDRNHKRLLALAQDSTPPVIYIGPETGVVPARAVLEACMQRGARNNTSYFGYSASGKDARYSREWTLLAESGHLTYRTAVSRDGPEGTQRVYV
jgi:sulfite reductase alpha subunit-like flavoprotein